MSKEKSSYEKLRHQDPERARKDAGIFAKLLHGAAARNQQLNHRVCHVVLKDVPADLGSNAAFHCGPLPANSCEVVLYVESDLASTIRSTISREMKRTFQVTSVVCMYEGYYIAMPPDEAEWPCARGRIYFGGGTISDRSLEEQGASFSECLDFVRETVEMFDLRGLETRLAARYQPMRKLLMPIIQAKRPRWAKKVTNLGYWPYWLRRTVRWALK